METQQKGTSDENLIILETKSYNLSLENEEYKLTVNLTEKYLEFKLEPKNVIYNFYYKEKFDLSTINKNKYFIKEFSELRKPFEIFDKKFNNKQVKLSKQREDAINLTILTFLDEEEIKKNLELKQFKVEERDIISTLLTKFKEMEKEVLELKKNINEMNKRLSSIEENQGNEMNKKIELLFEDYLKRKKEEEEILKKEEEIRIQKEEEIKRQKEEEIKRQKEEELIRQKEEEKYNDNVNLFNDFQCQDVHNIKDFDYISNNFNLNSTNVAVYSIIRNNERLYELACCKIGKRDKDDKYDIVIYNILLNKKTNAIYGVKFFETIKHYYHSSSKKHFLLTSNSQTIQLWNITSKIITRELKLKSDYTNHNWNGHYSQCSCLLFNNDNYLILSGGYNSNNNYGYEIINFTNDRQNSIGRTELLRVNYIEATYIENKPYILLSGNYHSESYDYNNGKLKIYKSKNQENEKACSSIINLFKNKNDKIYLISGNDKGSVAIFDFETTVEKFSINLSNSRIYGLCSLNKQYFLVGDNKEIKVIDFDKESVIKSYNKDFIDSNIQGIKKIIIPEKGEIIISYTNNKIILWK